jgi:hypothetical protein
MTGRRNRDLERARGDFLNAERLSIAVLREGLSIDRGAAEVDSDVSVEAVSPSVDAVAFAFVGSACS